MRARQIKATGGGGGGAWGSITGALADQTDLQGVLDDKAEKVHEHDAADVISGTFADARISASSVTQHQAALAISSTQVSGTKTSSYISDFDEAVEDKIGTKLVAGSLLDVSYNDTTGDTTVDVDLSEAAATAIDLADTIAFTDVSAADANAKTTLVDKLYEQYKLMPKRIFRFFTDFISETSTTSTDNGLGEINSGTSALTAAVGINNNNAWGAVESATGTTATGRAALTTMTTLGFFGGGRAWFEARQFMAVLSDATQRYQCAFGFMDNFTGINQTDGIYFLYDEGGVSTGSAASLNWQVVTVKGGVRTFTTTSTAAASGTWTRFGIEVNDDASSVTFYIDDVAVATHTTNIPNASGQQTGFGTLIIKSVGTTSRAQRFDYLNVVIEYTNNR